MRHQRRESLFTPLLVEEIEHEQLQIGLGLS